jgi:MFS superfamily sulfate permease-like transporter
MPIQFKEEDGGKILVIQVSGKLTKADYEHFVPEFDRLIEQHGKLRLLFDMSGFHGWEVSAMWEDIKFGIEHFADIERLAMVGETQWQHGMATFCKPFTKAAIRYFDHADAAAARQWLGQSQPVTTTGEPYASPNSY